MQRKEMILECSKLWDDIKRFTEEKTGTSADGLRFETELSEIGVDDFTFDEITEGIMDEYDEATGMAIAEECETMKDVYDVMFQELVDSYSWDSVEMDVWNFLAECVVRHAHPEKALNGIVFTPDEISIDILLDRGFEFSKSDVDAVVDEANRKYGVSLPKKFSSDDMIGTLFDQLAYEVDAKEQEKREAEEKEKEERSAKIAEEREAMRQRQAERKQKTSCLQTLGYAFLLYILPFLIIAGILALIFSHIY
ncbi:MAG: hypothetical protein LUH23_05335 [Oscillospiraceae bacterium]|nr:hypothetical protein [Oscillospiraceae bacterium]